MVKIRLRYVVEDTDRHGNPRLYFRRKGERKVRLPGLPGSEEFMAAYKAALLASGEKRPQSARPARGSFGHLCLTYYCSATFRALDGSTQSWRRRALGAVCERHGTKPVSLMQGKHVRMLRDELADRPGAARNRLKALRALFRWATEADEAPHDPTRDVKAITYATKGHQTWTLEEVEALGPSDTVPAGKLFWKTSRWAAVDSLSTIWVLVSTQLESIQERRPSRVSTATDMGIAVLMLKVTSGFFLIGLSAVDADRARNMQLLKDQEWFDIPLVYTNGGRAILAVEKGPPGDRAFADAFAAWSK